MWCYGGSSHDSRQTNKESVSTQAEMDGYAHQQVDFGSLITPTSVLSQFFLWAFWWWSCRFTLRSQLNLKFIWGGLETSQASPWGVRASISKRFHLLSYTVRHPSQWRTASLGLRACVRGFKIHTQKNHVFCVTCLYFVCDWWYYMSQSKYNTHTHQNTQIHKPHINGLYPLSPEPQRPQRQEGMLPAVLTLSGEWLFDWG